MSQGLLRDMVEYPRVHANTTLNNTSELPIQAEIFALFAVVEHSGGACLVAVAPVPIAVMTVWYPSIGSSVISADE